jgi:hypothetical protein
LKIKEVKKMVRGKMAGVGLLLLVVLIWALPAGAYDENVVDIKGTVFAVDNDATGKVTAVSILDAAGEEYFVVHDTVGDQLLKLVDKNVKATGVINVGADGKKNMKVHKFELFAT